MKLLKLYITGLLTVIFLAGTATAGVRPQLTRIVAYAQDRETPVDVINDSQETYMVQAWLEDLRGNDNDLPLVQSPHTGYRCRKYRQKPAVQISW